VAKNTLILEYLKDSLNTVLKDDSPEKLSNSTLLY
jgi:hypothetical protein